MKIPLFQVDAFTNSVFGGNPAAVCPLESWLDNDTLQKIAAENNLSETAFFVKTGAEYELKWFTPKVEVNLCGHATLATAHVLFQYLNFSGEEIRFTTMSGQLRVKREKNLLVLDFPASPAEPLTVAPHDLPEGLGKSPLEIHKSRDILALFETQQDILDLEPDFGLLKRLDCLGIIVTAPGEKADFVSRFFAPRAGINEDPVTGSAHTTLIPFWSQRLNKQEMLAFQLSERKGELFCRDMGERVEIAGRAVLYLTGEISI